MDEAEILQRLHDSEINAELSWFYDAGFRWRLGDPLNGWSAEGGAETASGAIRELAGAAAAKFPRSAFARWWKEHRPP